LRPARWSRTIGTATSAFAQSEAVLYTFRRGTHAALPYAGLVRDAAGNLYGTTYEGGPDGLSGFGTVFKVDSTGHEALLYRFTGGLDGAYPYGSLLMDPSGNLYGTTYFGGDSTSADAGAAPPKVGGGGVVFKLSPSQSGTWTETLLHSVADSPDGFAPASGTLLLKKGALFGTTSSGGSANFSTVFKVVP
jgi:uncharacterized repeat protein (TIGR03803 family)